MRFRLGNSRETERRVAFSMQDIILPFRLGTSFRAFLGLAVCLPLAAQSYVVSTFAGGSPAPATASATSMALGSPGRVAADPSGNIYFTALNSVFRLDTSGTVTRIAGDGRPGFSGDGGPATSAQLNSPQGLAIDTAGNVYIADTGNQRVRLVSNGIITTFAGSGTPGYAGEYGDPTQAELHLPMAVALDTSGGVYICDTANNLIRVVKDGIISPFAGNGIAGFSSDGVQAIVAALNVPTDIAFDSSGNLYIADTNNARIREVSAGVISSPIAGGGGTTYEEGGEAFTTVLNGPHGIAIDPKGNIYIADTDANRVRKVSNGVITTLAGTNGYGFSGDGGAATSAQINTPSSVATDISGNVYFVDFANARVRKVNSDGTISTVAGNGASYYSGDGGAAQNALMNSPSAVAAGPGGVVYIADTNNQRIREIAADGTISTVAGNGAPGYAGDGGAPAAAQIAFPQGVATDAAGNLYIADTANQRVRKVTAGTIATVAGNGTAGYGGDGGSAASAMLNAPVAVAAGRAGDFYIADYSNNAIRRVSADGTISTVAGNGAPGYSGDGGPAAKAQLNGPMGLALDSAGNLYVADSNNHVVRKITPDGTITTIAGTGNAGYSGDGGPASMAQLILPIGVALGPDGSVYITDSGVGRIRLITGGLIVTIAGTGTPGYSGDNGPASSAQFNTLAGISADPSGNVYVADRGNNAIRLLQLVAPAPSVGAVTNSASNLEGPIAPGEAITIYGTGIGPGELTTYQPRSDGSIPTQTGGVTVYIGGAPAPIVYAWTNQISAIVPYEVTPGSSAVRVQFQGQISLDLPVTAAATAPGIFTADSSGKGQALAFNEDGSANSQASPVAQGGLVTVYITGTGLVSPAVPDGAPNGKGLAQPLAPITATIGGQTATVEYAGGADGLSAGIVRVDIRVPSGITGSVPVIVQTGGVSSQAGVTIAVK